MYSKLYYKIGEVSVMLGVSVETLHYWEKMFKQLKPPRTQKGQRKFRPEDVELCKLIKEMLRDKGFSINCAQKQLDDIRKYPPRHQIACKTSKKALRLLSEIKNRSNDKHIIVRVKAVENWILANQDS